MQSFKTNDNITLRYVDTGREIEDQGKAAKPWLVLIHGFTGSSLVWQRNIAALSEIYRVIAPDLRGHGESDKPRHGFHVSRLAMDLRELLRHLSDTGRSEGGIAKFRCRAIGGSLGCSILWCYAELFTTSNFTHMVFVDQSPLQNQTLDGWDARFCNRGMNTPSAVASLQATLSLSPSTAHKSTIAGCLSYRSHPLPTDTVTPDQYQEDEEFFLREAVKGNGEWYGKLMADHTALDWRESIKACFGSGSGSSTKVLVVASERSGCFPAKGPLKVVEFVNGEHEDGKVTDEGLAKGCAVSWGGHWCYWEDPIAFNELALKFLEL